MIWGNSAMEKIFKEENGNFMIDCSSALWATDKLHEQYQAAQCSLSDVDWILETDGKIVLVEYKNANVAGAQNPEAFKPKEEKVIDKVVKKFYDSLHYLILLGKTKPKEYVYILEHPNGDSVSRKMIRNRMKSKLPFLLQENVGEGRKLIEKLDVLSIDEWNANERYCEFPIMPCE